MRLIDDSSECNFLDNRCQWLITEGRIELIDGARTKRKIVRVEMKARVTRWEQPAQQALGRDCRHYKPAAIALPAGDGPPMGSNRKY
jgi:hypothetical protein